MPAAIPKFHRLAVTDVRRETADAVSIAFGVPPELAADYAFAAGQYLNLRALISGEEVRRSYSICAAPGDGELRIAVKRTDPGVFSAWANTEIARGDEIDVMTPTGRFGFDAAPRDGRVHVAFAAGSGITPILSLVRHALRSEPSSRVFLFYGNRTARDILFLEEIEELKDSFLTRLSVFHILSREEQDVPLLNGRLEIGRAHV